MQKIYDVVVIGLGAMGSSALYHLSGKNLKILGIDRFNPPHIFGSSHGETRIIREAYFEHPLYVPLIQRAYKLWYELQEKSDETLIVETGGLMLGDLESETVTGSELSAVSHNLDYKKFDSSEIKQEFNAFKVDDNTIGIFERKAGYLFPEKCISENLKQAKINDAEIITDTVVKDWKINYEYISVITDNEEYKAKKIIISAGAWVKDLIKINLPIKVSREVLFWIEDKENNLKDRPIYIWEYEKDKIFYGFPTINNRAKLAFHHQNNLTAPNLINREISESEKQKMLSVAHKYLNLIGSVVKAEVCMYTNTPDHHFVIDYHPDNKNIIIASPCSGHGFKFSSVIGEILSDMALDKDVSKDIEPFRISRFNS